MAFAEPALSCEGLAPVARVWQVEHFAGTFVLALAAESDREGLERGVAHERSEHLRLEMGHVNQGELSQLGNVLDGRQVCQALPRLDPRRARRNEADRLCGPPPTSRASCATSTSAASRSGR